MSEQTAWFIMGMIVGFIVWCLSDFEIDVKKWVDRYDNHFKKEGEGE